MLGGNGAANHLAGGDGNDGLWGSNGDDVLEGGAGDGKLNGGPDDDIFVFTPDGGNDIIMDFTDGEDRIDLSAFTDIVSLDDLSMDQQEDNVVINLSTQGGGTIVVSDFDIAGLDATDFIF